MKKDGNIKKQVIKSYSIPYGSTGQVEAKLRDLVNEIVKLAIKYECSISIENLDFTQKKSILRHFGSKKYNRMLSGFVYSKFRQILVVACEKNGVYVKLINPEFTSTIGIFKYAKLHGLSSGFAAAFVIGRRSLGYKEKINGQARIILK
ncbi:MAG: IS200/IS605 family element transposase accessory protein TnpB [Calothrix sp. SM1_7_51]|nr:IS200/IS605 family element transposase accessory protein TnpB [Calothrix sp. SM1_7_51]